MKETPKNIPTREPSLRRPKFQMSPQLLVMILISLLALALPLTILSIGLVRMSRQPGQPHPAPEAPGIRAILEKVADEKLSPAALDDDRGQFVIFESPANRPQVRKRIEDAVQSLGGSVLQDNPQDGLTVRIPADAANRFQTTALSGAKVIAKPSIKNDLLLYRIRFEP